MNFAYLGYGVVPRETIEAGSFITFYAGKYSTTPPSDADDDTYIFEICSKKRAW